MKWILIGIVAVAILFLFIRSQSPKQLDNHQHFVAQTPIIKVNNESIWFAGETHSWANGEEGKTYYTEIPPNRVKGSDPTIVSPESQLIIDFQDKPRTLKVNQWVNEKPVPQEIVNGNMLILPKEEGHYFYDVVAEWNDGFGTFAFSIKVS